ncbi:hypothetical protein NB311A_07358 [Nitrobacter sp. Nb-311A]|nr:hypothetical protein NB311A_07358 [Nitrobacter sp. Nb-311A]
MLTREAAEMVARASGRKIIPVARVIDRLLAEAGYSKAVRRRMISEVRGEMDNAPRDHERTVPP